MKPVDVNSSAYIDFNEPNNKEDLKFKVVGYVWMSSYTNIIAKTYAPDWSEGVFLIKKELKVLLHVTSDVNA